ncbi:Levodione reductase [Tolypocladium ophioglossoides CBS 100239]|uniref:Levodione reductase n=1 Tax=Tolypocladium ophioglossoides (strain CBS 100239) TaxID=1163406 RepID=A0A0L0N5W8_TOLOC|nr:Levodione reductase [Tolypocladium ophioglossoides CBS 100239]
MSLAGRTALVTGAGGGLGLAIADALLAAGANIIVCDVHAGRLAAAEDVLHAQGRPDRTLVLAADVTDEGSVATLIRAGVRRFGRLDAVVNNAAVMDRFDPAGACPKALWDAVLAVNLTGPFLVTQAAVLQMQAQQPPGGLVVNVASNASVRGLSAGVAYTAAKHGLLGLTRNTAGSYAESAIHSVALLLGGMDATNIGDAFAGGVNREAMARMLATQPGNRCVPTEHVARYVVFLCGEGMAKSVNGSCVTINDNWPEA